MVASQSNDVRRNLLKGRPRRARCVSIFQFLIFDYPSAFSGCSGCWCWTGCTCVVCHLCLPVCSSFGKRAMLLRVYVLLTLFCVASTHLQWKRDELASSSSISCTYKVEKLNTDQCWQTPYRSIHTQYMRRWTVEHVVSTRISCYRGCWKCFTCTAHPISHIKAKRTHQDGSVVAIAFVLNRTKRNSKRQHRPNFEYFAVPLDISRQQDQLPEERWSFHPIHKYLLLNESDDKHYK